MPLLNDFISLFYPDICLACGKSLSKGEDTLCTVCMGELPVTGFHKWAENPVAEAFWGKQQIKAATALYYFHKGSRIQHLIHQLKYKGKQEIGIYLGKLYGHELQATEQFADVDYIVPVPLHPAKLRKRGYNQSECFAAGLEESMNAKMDTKNLIRATETSTQTKKSRIERWQNVQSVFQIKDEKLFENKHILVVDDVITTGATMEGCLEKLKDIKGIRLSVAAIAVAGD